MKLSKTLSKLRPHLPITLQNYELLLKSCTALLFLTLIAASIWLGGPYLDVIGISLLQSEKRLYLVLFLYLLWILKFLLLDLDTAQPFQSKHPTLRKKLQNLQTRFLGALTFLRKTTVTRQNKLIRLKELPWVLLIGQKDAGKTSLLANSSVQFILQRQFQQDKEALQPSEHCDWWVTKEACIIDVPGNYTAKNISMGLWLYLLYLIKKLRGKEAIKGLILTLPLPQLMKQQNLKHFQLYLHHLFQQLNTYQSFFSNQIPCTIVITKCDLLPGFIEFFAESPNDEITQAWGISLSDARKSNLQDVFIDRFNLLIKKLNQQLLWRLHQERNPMARPFIKDFPLQLERMKNWLCDFIKQYQSQSFNLTLQGIYLTSSLQQHNTKKEITLEEINHTQRSVALFKAPMANSRAFFVKQFIAQGVLLNEKHTLPQASPIQWKKRFSYVVAAGVVISSAILLGKDFEQGINQAYAIQNYLTEYQLAVQKNQNTLEHLMLATSLLDTLQNIGKKTDYKFNLNYLLSFYSHKSQEKANTVYEEALKEILLPEVKNLLEDTLKNPVNKTNENIYAVLKAYLMLGDTRYFQSDILINTIEQILPSSFSKEKIARLVQHLQVAMQTANISHTLDANLILETRTYLQALPSFQLSYVILKNINGNNTAKQLMLNNDNPVFINSSEINAIPSMFTSKTFTLIHNQEIVTAVQEAQLGNWILGAINKNSDQAQSTNLVEQLRTAYVNHYVSTWETLLGNITLNTPQDLNALNNMLISLTSNNSPLLQLVRTLHENTFFEPISTASPKLQNVSLLLAKHQNSEDQLYHIFSALQNMQQYIQNILHNNSPKKAAFQAMSYHMAKHETPDAISQLRFVAEKTPDPIKTWLNKIANYAWRFLMQEAGSYIDLSWQKEVIDVYQKEIANRYPFNHTSDQDVDLKRFSDFFGNPGILLSFYQNYLSTFVDMSTTDWHWKKEENLKPPFTNDLLRQIQQGMLIHNVFFPNGDNKLFVQFALQPYQFSKNIKSVKLNINDKEIVDEQSGVNSHVVGWPNASKLKKSSVELTLADRKITRDYPGEWGWFKLINQAFDSVITKKQMIINLSQDNHDAKYLLFTEREHNPFLSLNMRHFYLPANLLAESGEKLNG